MHKVRSLFLSVLVPSAFLISGISQCGDDDQPRTGMLMVVDIDGADMTLVRLEDAAEVWRYNILSHHPEECTTASKCMLYETQHRVYDDRDYLDYTIIKMTYDNQTTFHRLAPDDPDHRIFDLIGLDFTSVSNGKCSAEPALTCDENAVLDLEDTCFMRFAHTFTVIQDDPIAGKITLLIPDGLNTRLLQVTLDYGKGEKCGKVEWVFNFEEWAPDLSCGPNDIQVINEPENDYLLVTCHTAGPEGGQGQIQMLRGLNVGIGSEWEQIWRFPDSSADQDNYLNTPHRGRLQMEDDGSYTLTYPHSDGLGDYWLSGNHGTVGMARLDSLESAPDYIADEGYNLDAETPGFGFVRGLEPLPDGRRVVSDSITFMPDPTHDSPLYVMQGAAVSDGSGLGSWSPDFERQNLIDASGRIEQKMSCGWTLLWGVHWLEYESLGSFFRTQNEAPIGTCYVENF